MTLQAFIAKINWRLIVFHFVALWFFCHAALTFTYLSEVHLVNIVRQTADENLSDVLRSYNVQPGELADFLALPYFVEFGGLFIAFLISILISVKRRWFWVNSLLVLILALLFYHRIDNLIWNNLREYFWFVGQQFNNTATEFLINGLLLLTVSFIFFFSKLSFKFIEGKRQALNKPLPHPETG